MRNQKVKQLRKQFLAATGRSPRKAQWDKRLDRFAGDEFRAFKKQARAN